MELYEDKNETPGTRPVPLLKATHFSRLCKLLNLLIQLGKAVCLVIKTEFGFHLFYHIYLSVIVMAAAAAAKSLQSCLTLCDPRDSSPPGSPVPGTLQARTLEWVAISFSKAWKWKVKVKSLSRVRLLATPWTAAYQAPLPVWFSRQEYWSGVPLPSPIVMAKKDFFFFLE